MKKILSVALVLILCLSVVGCSNSQTVDTAKEKEVALKEKELELKEKELELKQKEIELKEKEEKLESKDNTPDKKETSIDKSLKTEKIKLTSQAQKEINIFLSNFTEVYFPDFKDYTYSEDLIKFGVSHTYINNFKAIKIPENSSTGYLDKKYVARNVEKYFGQKADHHKTQYYDFDGTNYIIQLADGEMYPMAIVEEMYDNKDGTYTVYFYEVQTYDGSFPLDYSSSYNDLERVVKNNPNERIKGSRKKAIVSKHDFEGKKRYKLLSYITINES